MDLRALDLIIDKEIFGKERPTAIMYTDASEIAGKTFDLCPFYSTDIAAAWLVVDLIKMREREVFHLQFYNGKWECGFEVVNYDLLEDPVMNESASLAICLAALKAKGIDVSEWET